MIVLTSNPGPSPIRFAPISRRKVRAQVKRLWNRALKRPVKLSRQDKRYFRAMGRLLLIDSPRQPISFYTLPKPLKTFGTKRRKRRTVRP